MKFKFQLNNVEAHTQASKKAKDDPELFWGEVAEEFTWKGRWNKVLNWNFEEPKIEWFGGAKLNITENCLDRHLAENGETTALIWEPNDPTDPTLTFTYKQLHEEVCRTANMLKDLGIRKGDRVCLYMGMVPQLAFAVLACARIGAVHSVIFGGFSAKSVADRVQDTGAEYVITCDGAYRGAKEITLKTVVDEALQTCDFVKKVLVFKRTNCDITMVEKRDVWWHDAIRNAGTICPAEPMDAEDMLFILYTSGSTGKPKGVVHTCGGYMVWSVYTFVNVFQYKPGEVFFCTADLGWITGHSYFAYGPFGAGATNLIFEGIPTWPDAGRFWDIVEKHKVNILYTAPTAIRSLMSAGDEFVEGKDLSTLRVLGTVGEPINEEAWHWYKDKIGKGNCPIVDTWWQTETGGVMISNLAGVTPERPAWATLPLPGIQPVLVDENGHPAQPNEDGITSGNLCMQAPWPGMIRTIYGDHERCRTTYFSTYPGMYFTGDGCLKDAAGNYRITGRVDDVLNVSGHRIGTAEVENAVNAHHGVIESAVVGYPHDIKGQGIYVYVIGKDEGNLKEGINKTVADLIGPIARPDKIQVVNGLPKTRSGKIMRRILRKIAEGDIENVGDVSTLLNPEVVEEIVEGRREL